LTLLVNKENGARHIQKFVEMGFAACTSCVVPIQMAGLKFIKKIIEEFGGLRDFEFPQVSLMEQYQAQIMSSLAPILETRKDVPRLLAKGIQVLSIFISDGVAKDVNRPTKILTNMLTHVKNGERISNSSLQAETTIQLAVLAAWSRILGSSRRSNA